MCSSLGRTTSPIPRSTLLPLVLGVRLGPHGLFPNKFGMCTCDILAQLTFENAYMHAIKINENRGNDFEGKQEGIYERILVREKMEWRNLVIKLQS